MNIFEQIKIKRPHELTAVLRSLKEAVANGQLQQLEPEASPFVTKEPLTSIPAEGPWPDYIEMRFIDGQGKCYKLAVETYHGSGGTWGLADEAV